jgi:hypothetical protein
MKRHTWLWKATDILTMQNRILSFCRHHNVGTIFLQLSNQVTDNQYRMFISAATALGIEIHAAGGDEKWALTAYYSNIQAMLNRIKSYNNASLPEQQFTGIHFDIEPYTLRASQGDPADWATQSSQIIREWMLNVNRYTDFIAQSIQVPVSCTLHFSMDDKLTGDPTYPYVDEFMIGKHDKVAITAYRDFALGNDSITYHAQAEIDSAEAQKKPMDGIGACHHPKNVEGVYLERGRLFLFSHEPTAKLSASSLHNFSRGNATKHLKLKTNIRSLLVSIL